MAELTSFDGSGFAPFRRQLRVENGVAKFTLTEAATLTARSPNFMDIDVGGATKIVTLPAEADADGLFFFLYNSSGAGEDITVNDDAAATVVTVNPSEAALVACDGSTWYKLFVTTIEDPSFAGTVTLADGSLLERPGAGTGTGDIIEHVGSSAEGYNVVVYDATVVPAAVSTALLTIPAGSIVDSVHAACAATLTAGGTSVTWSIGIAADVDQYGTATTDDYTTQGDDLTTDSKWSCVAPVTPLTGAGDQLGIFDPAAVAVVLSAAATGGASAGDTALSVGSVRVRIQYRTALPLADA